MEVRVGYAVCHEGRQTLVSGLEIGEGVGDSGKSCSSYVLTLSCLILRIELGQFSYGHNLTTGSGFSNSLKMKCILLC